jgi:RimJ/RimL family protein N-acetyltransferase
MIGLETDRVVFRQWQKSDFVAFAAFYANEQNARFVGGVKSPEESWRLMATYIGHYTLNGFSYLAVNEKATGNLVGTVGLWYSLPWPEPELGYWLLPDAQGKGYGVEAGRAVKDYAMSTLHFKSLVSYIDPVNESSKTLARRLDAKYDKTINLLEFGPHEVYRYM